MGLFLFRKSPFFDKKTEQEPGYPRVEDGHMVFYRDDVSDLPDIPDDDTLLPQPQPEQEEKTGKAEAGKAAGRRKEKQRRKVYGLMPAWLVTSLDIILLGASLITFALFHHVLPKEMGFKGIQTYGEPGDWSEKWSEFFTSDGSVEITDTSYRSGSIYVNMVTVSENEVTYHIADIYIASIYNFKTAFANDTYGRGFTQTTPTMAKNNNAIIATNGDYYGFREQGVVIRNGMVYRSETWEDVCVLYYNGVMETYSAEEFDIQQAIDGGAWQAWSFGPALLDGEGNAITSFDSSIEGLNPRCGLGYFEPGHYCLVAIDGRQTGHSVGMTLEEMAALFEEIGCVAAYNMDGGKTAVMAFMGEVYNRPYEGGRKVSDIIFIAETDEAA